MTPIPNNPGKNPLDAVTRANFPGKDKSFEHIAVNGRFNQYTSGYWALALPALATRYVGRYFTKLFKLDKPESKFFLPFEARRPRLYAGVAGGWMAFITGYYALSTWKDIKRICRETVAFEFDKKPAEVTLGDFMRSKNMIIRRTMKNFTNFNIRRALVASTFFANFLPWKPFKNEEADSVDLGVGVSGGYLVHDVFFRKETFFEALQKFIDEKINHSDSVGQIVADTDLMNLYAIHARDSSGGKLTQSDMDTAGWRSDQIIFGRMADLMNQTYKNTPMTQDDPADFTIPKLIYLLGNGHIKRDNIRQSLAYIEVANRHGMKAVKQLEKELGRGVGLDAAIQPFAINLPTQLQTEKAVEGDEAIAKKHVDRLSEVRQKNEFQAEYRAV